MTALIRSFSLFAAGLCILVAGVVTPASAQDANASAQQAYRDIEKTLGVVPSFLKAFPQAGVAAAWAEMKAIQFNPNTKLDGKTKELIGLAVAAQVPCQYCVYAHAAAAKLNGATDEEIGEAVAMAALTRHWSTVLQGSQADYDTFKREIDTMVRMATEHMAKTEKTGMQTKMKK